MSDIFKITSEDNPEAARILESEFNHYMEDHPELAREFEEAVQDAHLNLMLYGSVDNPNLRGGDAH